MTKDEDRMLAAAHKHVMDIKLSSRRTLMTIEQKDGIAFWKAAMARHYRARVDRELCALYTDLLNVVDWKMRPNWRRASDPATDVFYWKLCADYNRYKAEIIVDPGERAVLVALSRNSYDWGERTGSPVLRPIDPVWLEHMPQLLRVLVPSVRAAPAGPRRGQARVRRGRGLDRHHRRYYVRRLEAHPAEHPRQPEHMDPRELTPQTPPPPTMYYFLSDEMDMDIIKNDPAIYAKMSFLSSEIKDYILKFGPSQPLQNDLPNKIFPYEINKEKIKISFNDKHYYRILSDKSKCHRDWLSYSVSKNKIFCIHCMLFGTNLHSNLEKSWTKEGFNKWKNCSFAIQRHELTPDHVTSSLKFKLRQKKVPILPLIENNRKTQIAMNIDLLNLLTIRARVPILTAIFFILFIATGINFRKTRQRLSSGSVEKLNLNFEFSLFQQIPTHTLHLLYIMSGGENFEKIRHGRNRDNIL
ncbi:hypothetical protein AGLY_010945 [Aphis glycines]|uniref:14-3-3 domain-containing protein n=1 Tax=Aphis glycines TaxID=307491 RepID=A0A6G0TC12_APHGL|nr:hypothetical protein AGLY_010945 [Aphis glycines]